MNSPNSNLPQQPLKVERDAMGRFYVVGPNGRYCDSYPETPRQACERQARDMQQQAVDAAIDAAVAAIVKTSLVFTRLLRAAVLVSLPSVVRFVATSALVQHVLSHRR